MPGPVPGIHVFLHRQDAAHLADNIDANLQDSTLIVGVLDWITAELVRIYRNVSPEDAQTIVDELVTRRAPAIQNFRGFLKVLNPKLRAGDHILLLLYECGKVGASLAQLDAWVRPTMRANLKATLIRMVDSNDSAHFDGEKYFITRLGAKEVEVKKLHDPS
jgi:hypothetical protein